MFDARIEAPAQRDCKTKTRSAGTLASDEACTYWKSGELPMRTTVILVMCALAVPLLLAQDGPRAPQGMISDWTHRQALYPDSKDPLVMERIRTDPRWAQSTFRRHEALWPENSGKRRQRGHRDWSVSLGTVPLGPVFDFSFDIAPEVAYGSLNTADQGNGEFLATSGSLTITAGN